MSFRKRFQVPRRRKVKLSSLDPAQTHGLDRREAERRLERALEQLRELQHLLWAENKHAVLVVLQAMDTGGKDGVIRHVMSGMNPQGVKVHSFKVPTSEEADHDFLWRIHKVVPAKGEIGVFNRSHYEDVIVVRVHKIVPEAVWRRRFDQINEFERLLAANHVTILKFFLHISKAEQLERLKARLEDPSKHWKFSPGDFEERKHWPKYQQAFQEAINECSSTHAPWYVIPADRKWFRNLAVAEILLETLKGLKMRYPKPTHDLSKIVVK